mmetsp:Transcript_6806/g.25422  ORF Transcript_6806/g.25422 Transcript_6806/m.25422 type:complete len:365 (-) Transcript_6806:1187-2281(-)
MFSLLGFDAYASDEENNNDDQDKMPQKEGGSLVSDESRVEMKGQIEPPTADTSATKPKSALVNPPHSEQQQLIKENEPAIIFGAYTDEQIDQPVSQSALALNLGNIQEKSLSYSDIVSRLGILDEYATKSKFSSDVLVDSDDEELAELQQLRGTDSMENTTQSRVEHDLSSAPKSNLLKRKRIDLNELQQQLNEQEPDSKRPRTSAPKLPDFLTSSQDNRTKIEIIDEDDGNEYDDDSDEFELDVDAYEPLPKATATKSEARVPAAPEDIDNMNLPDHIKKELRNREVKEITADHLIEERELSRQKRLRDYHQRSIFDNELESAKHRMQTTAGNLIGHEMMKLAQESIAMDINAGAGGKKKTKR